MRHPRRLLARARPNGATGRRRTSESRRWRARNWPEKWTRFAYSSWSPVLTCLSWRGSDHVDDFLCGQNGTCVVRQIDVESGVHLRVRVIRRRVLHHRDVVAELGGETDGRFDAGMRDEADDGQ